MREVNTRKTTFISLLYRGQTINRIELLYICTATVCSIAQQMRQQFMIAQARLWLSKLCEDISLWLA